MNLTSKAQKLMDYRSRQFSGQMIDVFQLVDHIATIYRKDLRKQKQFLMEQGFSEYGAIRHIYNLDKEEIL